MYINCLELLAAMLAANTFLKDVSGVSLLLQLSNNTAVAYINKKCLPIHSSFQATLHFSLHKYRLHLYVLAASVMLGQLSECACACVCMTACT